MSAALYFAGGVLFGLGLLYWWGRSMRGFLMEFGQHKGHCATKVRAAAECNCGLYYAVRLAHGFLKWRVTF